MHRALVVLALIGCSKGASDADCAKVRQVVDAVPRRYRGQPNGAPPASLTRLGSLCPGIATR